MKLSLLSIFEAVVAKNPTHEDLEEYGKQLRKVNVPTKKKKSSKKSFDFRRLKK